MLSSFRLYNIQFKKVKILLGPATEVRGPDMRAGGRITQRPNVNQLFNHWYFRREEMQKETNVNKAQRVEIINILIKWIF